MTALRIHLLGPFEVIRDGQPLTTRAWRSQQTRTILKILLARHGHVVPADQLLEILWPGEDLSAARRRLYVRISQLRKALCPEGPTDCILTVEGGYSFKADADCWIDAFEFERQAQQGRLCQESGDLAGAIIAYEAARSLYRGDFLEEDLYMDWAFAERERLRERFLTALTELAECYARQGRYRRAIARCHQLLGIDPCREAAYLRLMLYHYYAGEQAQSLRAYERCRQILADELEVEPLPTTTALHEQIRQRRVEPLDGTGHYPKPVHDRHLRQVPYSLGRTPFVGRGEEYARLIGLVEASFDNRGSVALVSGEAGSGKTRLVQEALEYANAQGAITLEGQCSELGRVLPYQPFVQALRKYLPLAHEQHLNRFPAVWLVEIAQLLPELSKMVSDVSPVATLPPEHQKSRLFEGITQFIVHISQEQPLAIFLDDLHWAERPTMELLHYVALGIGAEKVLLVGAYRREEVAEDHPLKKLLRETGRVESLVRIDLQPLSQDAVTRLVAQVSCSSAVGELFSRRIFRETRGNPLFVTATLQNLFEEGILYVDEEGGWATDYDASTVDRAELMIPPTIREVIEARLARLARTSRRLLVLGSVLGQEFSLDYLQQASDRGEDELFEAINDLTRRRFLQEESAIRGYRFDHPKVREVVYAGLDGPQQAALHRRAGEALERHHQADLAQVAGQLVHHFRLAGRAQRTVRYAIMAGQEALRMCAHQEAGEYWHYASIAAGQAGLSLTDAQQMAIQQGLGDAHWMAGRYDQARACYEQALSHTESAAESDGIIFKIAYLEGQGGAPISSLLQRSRAFEDRLEKEYDPLLEAHHALQKGYTLMVQGLAAQARECYQRGWQIIFSLIAHGEEEQHAFDLAEAYRGRGEAGLWWGDYGRSARDLKNALPIYQRIGDMLGTMKTRVLQGELGYHTGAWDQALADLSQAVEMARRVEHLSLLAEALFRRGYVYCDRGDWGLAEREALESRSIAEEVGDLTGQAGAQFLLNRIALKQGEARQAVPSCQALETVLRALDSGLYLCLALRYLGWAYVSLGEAERALACCNEGLELAQKADFQREVGAIQRVWGEALAQQGEWEEGEARLRASVERLAHIGSPYELGESHRSLGTLYLRRDRSKMAREHWGTALTLFKDLGARYDVAVIQQMLSELALSEEKGSTDNL